MAAGLASDTCLVAACAMSSIFCSVSWDSCSAQHPAIASAGGGKCQVSLVGLAITRSDGPNMPKIQINYPRPKFPL